MSERPVARRTRAMLGLLAVAAASGCGRDRTGPGTHDAIPATKVASSSSPLSRASASTAPCPHDARWHLCSLVARLDKAGLVPHVDSSASPEHLPFLHAPGTIVHLGVGDLHTFIYDDTAALTRDVAGLDTLRVSPRGQTYPWSSTPTLVRSANLLAILLTPNERQIERIQLALEAGPPQPKVSERGPR